MSDKLKRVLDTNLAGLHVTDAQVNAVLRRVSQDEQRPRVIRWQAIAAVLLVLVLGAGVLLQTGILSDDSPQLTADVTRQGDFLTAAQVKKLLASAADLQFSVDEEAISALMTQVEKDGGCSRCWKFSALWGRRWGSGISARRWRSTRRLKESAIRGFCRA